ncbi:TA system VapC family ribonuclease toxin [uncultured Jatrophihabitans sp.]|uniref:TA system VapC family ribonuclease toxin n=1 Tax=uncultured Jatrophihabitans sp. TaxID=1610747 RepID=UPI0035CA443F
MSRALLDVNVLLALLDLDHVHHETARHWLTSEQDPSWSSCAITQNGLVRIMSSPAYPSGVSVAAARERLSQACATRLHEFWPCDVSVLDAGIGNDSILTSRQVTDVYLLALAVAHGGRLVTFDRSIRIDAVVGAGPHHLVAL